MRSRHALSEFDVLESYVITASDFCTAAANRGKLGRGDRLGG